MVNFLIWYVLFNLVVLIMTADNFWDDIEELYKDKTLKWIHILYALCLPMILLVIAILLIWFIIKTAIQYLDKPIFKKE